MKEFWYTIQFIFTVLGGWLGYFLGGCDGLLIALVAFAAIDYITGIMCAVSEKKLNSKIGFKGICRKVLIFTLVGVANIIDVQVIGTGSVLRTEHHRCAGHRHRQRTQDGGDILLSFKRRCITIGKRSSSGITYSKETERNLRATA